MSENENIQNSVVQLVEAFEGLQSHLEQKHFGKEMEDESDFENVPEDKREALDADFREAMISVFHNLEEQNHVELVEQVDITSGKRRAQTQLRKRIPC